MMYDNDKEQFFDIHVTIESDLESETMKRELQYVWDKDCLLLKRDVPV